MLGKLASQNRPYRAAHPRMTIGGSAPPPPPSPGSSPSIAHCVKNESGLRNSKDDFGTMISPLSKSLYHILEVGQPGITCEQPISCARYAWLHSSAWGSLVGGYIWIQCRLYTFQIALSNKPVVIKLQNLNMLNMMLPQERYCVLSEIFVIVRWFSQTLQAHKLNMIKREKLARHPRIIWRIWERDVTQTLRITESDRNHKSLLSSIIIQDDHSRSRTSEHYLWATYQLRPLCMVAFQRVGGSSGWLDLNSVQIRHFSYRAVKQTGHK